MYLVDQAVEDDPETVRLEDATRWREVRRFNAPVQLSVAAAHKACRQAVDPATALLISMAPCQSGSPEVHRWVHRLNAGERCRVNPTHTLHAVDNLALSAMAIALSNRVHGVGLGGAAGQAFEALSIALARLGTDAKEALIFAGDQKSTATGGPALGVALLVSGTRRPYRDGDRAIRIEKILRAPAAVYEATPHAAKGLAALVHALDELGPGPFDYEVPPAHGDGIDRIRVVGEVVA